MSHTSTLVAYARSSEFTKFNDFWWIKMPCPYRRIQWCEQCKQFCSCCKIDPKHDQNFIEHNLRHSTSGFIYTHRAYLHSWIGGTYKFIFPITRISLFHWFNWATWLPSKSLCTAGKFLCTVIWRNHNLIFKTQIGVSVIIDIYGPRKNKSFIRFVTDCPRLYVGLLWLVLGPCLEKLFDFERLDCLSEKPLDFCKKLSAAGLNLYNEKMVDYPHSCSIYVWMDIMIQPDRPYLNEIGIVNKQLLKAEWLSWPNKRY